MANVGKGAVKAPKMGTGTKVILALVAIVGLTMLFGGGDDAQPNSTETIDVADSLDIEEAVEAEDAPEPADRLTGPQRNALRNAESYLAMTGFSRQGLIDQLSSDAGNGYAVADATAAVDSLNVDWNEQAARSAQSYLELTGFSCQGLIEQLSSDAGSKYTVDQARFGATQAGAC